MIPPDIRLYSWVDVEEVLFRINPADWPEWIRWIRIYFDEISIGTLPNTKEKTIQWLSEIFDPRFSQTNLVPSIILESTSNTPRFLNIIFEVTTEEKSKTVIIPSFYKNPVFFPPTTFEHPKELPGDYPPIIAFHSFKGGVGRTHLALGLALALKKRYKYKPVLLIDGDLEAPGINWMVKKRIPVFPISYSDLLSLVHGDPDPEAKNSIELVAKQLENAQLDGIYILPAFRSFDHFSSREIRPEHIVRGSKDPFVLTKIIGELGKKLDVSAVIVDLRAGFSEISAGILLDPRVYRIIVTTFSNQAIEGSIQLFSALSKQSPSNLDYEPIPLCIFNQMPDELSIDYLYDCLEGINKSMRGFYESEDELEDLPNITIKYYPPLVASPPSWDELIGRIEKAGLIAQMANVLPWLPSPDEIKVQEPESNETKEAQIKIFKSERFRLEQFTKKLIYAETGDVNDFLVTNAINNLISDFKSRIPIAVVVGGKGSGKTYTFLRISQQHEWQKFAIAAKKGTGIIDINNSNILPLIWPINLKGEAKKIIPAALNNTINYLGLSHPENLEAVIDHIKNKLKLNLHSGEWREIWLNVIAWRAGFKYLDQNAGRSFINFLIQNNKNVLGIIDGLEDIFQELPKNSSQQTALRALIQDLPQFLDQQPLRPLGLIIFVRKDMIYNAILQNPGQLLALYEPYQLKWDEEEALKLAAWISWKSMVMKDPEPDYNTIDYPELLEKLNYLWARKLGRDRSKEAHSAAWIISALSDFKGNIQARDLVRFLHTSAEKSISDSYWDDRLLVPQAVKAAILECSNEKIKEIQFENPRLGELFTKMKNMPQEKRQIPFTIDSIGLAREELDLLDSNGVVTQEKEEYYIPEIFRGGLNFMFSKGARPKVLKLAKKISQLK